MNFIGTSEVVTPNGNILCKLGVYEPEIFAVDIDLTLADNKQINEYNHLFNGRRPAEYNL